MSIIIIIIITIIINPPLLIIAFTAGIYLTVHAERDHKSAKENNFFADFALTDLFLRLYKICCG